jgi:hypothetical protein
MNILTPNSTFGVFPLGANSRMNGASTNIERERHHAIDADSTFFLERLSGFIRVRPEHYFEKPLQTSTQVKVQVEQLLEKLQKLKWRLRLLTFVQ